MPSHIAVATDFSPRSDRALRRAIIMAKQADADLSLFHVVDDEQPKYLIDTQVAAARSILDETARTILQIDEVGTQVHIATGDVYSGILQLAEEIEPSVIILGPHRRQLRDVFGGTTAERTIAHSRFPVLMAAGVPSSGYDRVLVALDMDEASKVAARRVRTLPMLRASELLAMHAFDAPARGMLQRAMSDPEAVRHYVAGQERGADQQLESLLSEVELQARRLVVPINGGAARTILDAARQEEASLIVVGASQRTGVKRFLLGSVAEDVLNDADRDVLVIPNR